MTKDISLCEKTCSFGTLELCRARPSLLSCTEVLEYAQLFNFISRVYIKIRLHKPRPDFACAKASLVTQISHTPENRFFPKRIIQITNKQVNTLTENAQHQ